MVLDYVADVAKKAFVGFRLTADLKKQLEAIAVQEQRSLSQVCEMLLRLGVEAYRRQGPDYLRQLSSRNR